MRFRLFHLLCFAGTPLLSAAVAAGAQQLPPVEPPQPLPGVHADTTTTTLRVTATSNAVLAILEIRNNLYFIQL